MGTEVRDAATVLLVRDEPTPQGGTAMEVFMVRRHAGSGFVGGHHVFPGGVVDDADRDPAWSEWCSGAHDAFGVAAVRELLEEAAVLIAVHRETGRQATPSGDRIAELARDVHSGSLRFIDACAAENIQLGLDSLKLWSHWITPEGQPRRYDTRFFVAVAPPDQEAIHDELELTEGLWGTPASFLSRHAEGQVQMILPTVANLKSVEGFGRVDELLAAASAKGPISPTTPEMVRESDGSVTILVDGIAVWTEPKRLS